MEIEIDSKRNNPLLNRTEIYFTVKHEGDATPNREIIKSELAEKLNVKKESIIVSSIKSGFGIQQISGYAKVYSSDKKTMDSEPDYILRRNKLIEEKKAEKKKVTPAEPVSEEKPVEPTEEAPAPVQPVQETPIKVEEKPAEPASDEKPVQPTEEAPAPVQPVQENPEKTDEKEEIKPTEETPPQKEQTAEIKEESKDDVSEPKPSKKPIEEKEEEKTDEEPVEKKE